MSAITTEKSLIEFLEKDFEKNFPPNFLQKEKKTKELNVLYSFLFPIILNQIKTAMLEGKHSLTIGTRLCLDLVESLKKQKPRIIFQNYLPYSNTSEVYNDIHPLLSHLHSKDFENALDLYLGPLLLKRSIDLRYNHKEQKIYFYVVNVNNNNAPSKEEQFVDKALEMIEGAFGEQKVIARGTLPKPFPKKMDSPPLAPKKKIGKRLGTKTPYSKKITTPYQPVAAAAAAPTARQLHFESDSEEEEEEEDEDYTSSEEDEEQQEENELNLSFDFDDNSSDL